MTQDQIQIKTPEFVSLQFRLAGLGSRAAAMIIDQVILTLANTGLILLLIFTTNSDIWQVMEYGWMVAVWIIALFAVNWGYFFISEYFFNGKTIGKNIIGIRVIQENGHSITVLSAIIRNLLRAIDALPTGYFLGIILVFLHSKHKRLGDMAAGTIVVYERKVQRLKKTPLEKEIEHRNLNKDSISIDDFVMNSLGSKEYNLLKTYSYKLLELRDYPRNQLTRDMAAILFPKVGLEIGTKTNDELENILLVLYLKMREDWEYEL
ncbi:MAG TPA: RDD family protein [Candidatus Avamphibacillus sp.]|nr:RDD family protein [Candidatus Avamphibacillus sp.]